ncbi:hypothetical protein [Nostoc sp. LEGE 06077]|nr:hypothetical protein [Nostoc sp. LEGE 06077]
MVIYTALKRSPVNILLFRTAYIEAIALTMCNYQAFIEAIALYHV